MEMDSSLKYKKTTGLAPTPGQDFEITLAALLFLRGMNSGKEFQVGTNVLGAGAMDDIVFRLKSREESSAWATMFVQLKHKDNSWVNRDMLTNGRGKFSLAKYFQSYLEIKRTMSTERRDVLFDGDFKDCQFVIYTTAKADAQLVGECSGNLSCTDELLWSGSGSVHSFESDEDMLECLGECGVEGKEFLQQLKVFCCQPGVDGLKTVVKEELAKSDRENIGGLNLERLYDCYLDNVKVWWEKRGTSTEILHKGHNMLQKAVSNVRLESCSEQMLKDSMFALEFDDSSLLMLSEDLALVVSSEDSCRLTLAKLVQSTQAQSLVLSTEQLAANQSALLAQCRHKDKKRLIVLTKDWRCDRCDEYILVIKNIMDAKRENFSIVLLSDGNDIIRNQLSEKFPCSSYKDDFKASQLKPGLKGAILNISVSLQGHKISLGTLLNNNYEYVDQILTASLVVEIFQSAESPLAIGSALPEGIRYYVRRTLEQTLCLKASVFQDLQGTIAIRISQTESSDRGLFVKALDFVNSLTDSPSFSHRCKEVIVSELDKLPRVREGKYFEMFIGPKFKLGCYTCNRVVLRLGKETPVTALHVSPNEKAFLKVRFIFISNKTNDGDATKLSEFHQAKHILSLRDGQLRWVWSHNNIESIRKHIDEDQVSRFAPETVMDVEDRLVLVCAEPGMGKSTLMARLAKNTKEMYPHYFVILIALNDHAQLFAQGKHTNVLEFLSIAAKMDSPLQRSLLKFALEVSGNVVVIADGFDTFLPKYLEQSCHLLSSILEKTQAIKIWMTSRNSVKQLLENRWSKISAKICEFSKEEQKNFFQKFWEIKSSDEKLDEFIDRLLGMSVEDIGEKRNFLGISLQTRMLAEVYEDHVTLSAEKIELPRKLDLISLVEQFIEKKCICYFRDTLKIAPSDPHKETLLSMYKKDFFASHTKVALISILSIYEIKSLGLENILRESSTFLSDIRRGAYKSGFIDEIVNDKPRFIHYAFAEYFVANWFSQHFAANLEFVQSKIFTPDFNVIRYFFNGILCKGCVLHTAVLQENVEHVKALLKSEDVDVKAQDAGGRTALHLAASLGASEDKEENKRRFEILDLIIGKTSDFKVVDKVLCSSPLRYADITRWWTAIDKLLCKTDDNRQLKLTSRNIRNFDMLDAIFEHDLDKLLEFCLDNGLAVEHRDRKETRLLFRACSEGSVKVASLLIERNANINTTVSEKLHACARGPLITASTNGHLKIVKLLVEKYVASLASSLRWKLLGVLSIHPDIKTSKYINVKDGVGKTAMHHAASQGHTDVTTYLLSQGGDPLSRDGYNETPLHLATNCKGTLRVLLEALSEADRVSVINSRDNEGHSVFHNAARGGSVECLQLVFEAGGKLSQVDRNGETPLMTAARYGPRGKQDVVEWLLKNFSAKREGISLVDYINMKDKFGKTAIHHAACGGFVSCVKLLVEAGGKLSPVGPNGETPLMTATREGKQDVVEWLLKNFIAKREGISLVDYINMMDNVGKTAWDLTDTKCRKVIEKFEFHDTDKNFESDSYSVQSKDKNVDSKVQEIPVIQMGEVNKRLHLNEFPQSFSAAISSRWFLHPPMSEFKLNKLSEVKVKELDAYGVDFKPYYLQRMADSVPSSGILNVLVKSRTTVTAIKVWKALTTIYPSSTRRVLFLDLAALCLEDRLWGDWLLGGHWDISVVDCQENCPERDIAKLCDVILKMIDKVGKTNPLLLVGSKDHQLISRLQGVGCCISYRDSCKWSHLSEQAQKKILSAEMYLQGKPISFKEAFNDSFEMINEEVLSQLLKKELTRCGKPLVKVKVDRLFIERRLKRVGDEEVDSSSLLSDKAGRVALIVAEPGMGKSTLVTHLAKKAKEADLLSWVVHVKFHEWTSLLGTWESNSITAWEFLNRCALTPENELEKILFESRKKTLLIFVDGFDELSSKEAGNAVKLLGSFKDLEIRKLIISAPPFCASKLESTLGSKRYDLCKFSMAEQLRYFSVSNNTEVLDDLSKHPSWGVPLIAAMVAKEYEGHLSTAQEILEVYKSLDLTHLFDAIVTKDIELYKGYCLFAVLKNFEFVSLCEIFGSDEVTALYLAGKYAPPARQGSLYLPCVQNLEFLGTVDSKGFPSLVPRSFAEHFAAKWLLHNFTGNEKIAKRIFADPSLNGVRNIICSLLDSENHPGSSVFDNIRRQVKEEAVNKLDEKPGDMHDKIFAAAKEGNVIRLKAHVANGLSLHVLDSEGSTLLHHAAQCGHTHAVTYLTDQGLDEQAKNNNKETPLQLAVDAQHLEVVKHLLFQHGLDGGNSSIHLAARDGDLKTLEFLLLQKGVDINVVNDFWQTPMHLAAERNQLEILSYLIEKGAQFSADNSGSLPLHVAARRGYVEAVEALVAAKPSMVNSVDLLGQSALFVAVSESQLGVVECLLKVKEAVTEDEEGSSLLHCAVSEGDLEVVKYLLFEMKRGQGKEGKLFDINARDAQGCTALDIARSNGQEDVEMVLLDAGRKTSDGGGADAS